MQAYVAETMIYKFALRLKQHAIEYNIKTFLCSLKVGSKLLQKAHF